MIRGTPITKPKAASCGNSAPVATKLSNDTICCVGFGVVSLIIDDVTVWSGDDENMTVKKLKAIYWQQIKKGRCIELDFFGPLQGKTYEMDKETGDWILIRQNQGFA